MKKRAAKPKRAGATRAAKKTTGRTKKPAKAAASRPAKAAASPRPEPYTPAPLKGDGWPPFRYPLQ